MKAFRSVLTGGGVCLAALVLIIPFMLFGQTTSQEIWIMQAMQEMRQHFQLVPRLNGTVLPGQNPLQIMLLSFLPTSTALARLVMILVGLAVAAAVYLYAHILWGRRAGVYAALFTASSIGFLKGFGLLNTAAVPCAFFIWAFLIFSLVYLKGAGRNWYLPAYACLLAAILTGGLNLLVLFVGAVILLLLFDLAPGRFSHIRPVIGLILTVGAACVFYLTFWIVGSRTYASSFMWPGGHLGLFKSLAYTFYAPLPWLPLLVPAWIFTARPDDWKDWRELLPAKIVFVLVVILLWFSGKGLGGYALLAAPAAGLLIGYWAGRGLRTSGQLEIVRRVAFICTALILLVLSLVDLVLNPRMVLALSLVQGLLLVAVLVAAAAMLFLVKGRRYAPALIAGILAVGFLGWYTPLGAGLQEPPGEYLESIAQYQPLLVLQDDLIMRGCLGSAGAWPLVVGGQFVPVGSEAYLAVATDAIKDLLKNLQTRMQASVVSRIERGTTYALIRVAPREPQSPRDLPADDSVPWDEDDI